MGYNRLMADGYAQINQKRAEFVLKICREQNIKEFCVCAGARNAPLVQLLEQSAGLKRFHFFEERSAAFFALGRIRSSGSPVAVVTTSGTAAAECLPAVIEAYYQQLPLLAITADRPSRYRESGSPQTIDQIGLFSRYVESVWDCEAELSNSGWTNWTKHRPFQLNVCFEEPVK